MRMFLLTIAAFASAMVAKAAPEEPEKEITDTLKTSVVTGTRIEMDRFRLPAPVSVIGRSTIENSDESALMPSLMEEVPGLFVTSRTVTGYGVSTNAAGGIYLRGFGAGNGRTLILIDGHPQYMSIYGHAVADEYLSDLAERVEVTRGAASVIYGSNAMGGAINILTRQPDFTGNRINAKVMGGSYGLFRASATDQYATDRFYIVANAGYNRSDGHRPNSAFRSANGLLKASYKISDAWKVSAEGNILNAYSENPGKEDSPLLDGNADITRLMSWISLENHYDRTDGGLNLYFNRGNHIINDGYFAGGSPKEYLFHSTDWQGGVNLFQAVKLFKGNSVTGGIDMKYYGGDAYRNPVTEYYADHKKLHEEAAYILAQQFAGPFTFDAGVRVENHSLYGVEWVPQAGVSWLAAPGTSIKLSASKGFRTPNLRELYMYGVANENLEPEEAWSYDLTLSKRWLEGRLNTELSLYHTDGSNIVEVGVVDGWRANHNIGAFHNNGIEFCASWQALDNLKFNANYSYLHMSKIYTGAPGHKAYVSGTWNFGDFCLNVGAMGIKDLHISDSDSTITSDYVDLKCRFSWQATSWMSLFVRGENLLNKTYSTMDGFPMPGATFLGGVSISL